jgi:hypothetical protein
MADRHISSKMVRLPLVLLEMMKEDTLGTDNPGSKLLKIYEHFRPMIRLMTESGEFK